MPGWTCASCGRENPEGTTFCGHCGSPVAAGPAAAEPDVAEALRSFVVGAVADRLVETGGKLPEERRLVTALFADVSGFTSLAERLDPEQLLEVIDPVISALSSVVGRHEGYVEKFAGDALLALFGAPISHEDDAARALRVALEMHEVLARIVRDLPHDADLTLHVGINSGHGIARVLGSEARMDYAVLGDSVILAQRLESAAPSGETYVSETTVRLTESDFEFEPVGKLTLKGKAEAVPAWRLVGERAETRPPTQHSLVGREAELATVGAALDELLGGRGGVLAITGEAGIGKSRLAKAARDRGSATGVHWLHSRCLSYGAGVAYWPYLDLLRRFCALRTDAAPAATRAQLGSALTAAGVAETAPYFARLLGLSVDDDEVAGLEPEGYRRGLHDAFRSWLGTLARTTPVALAIEDVHWADASSLELTGELVRLSRSIPVLFMFVGRPEAREQIERTVGERELRSIRLAPLTAAGIAQLAGAILGGPPPERLVEFIEQRTSGNPFFVQELIRAVRDRGGLVLGNRGWTISRGWDERELPPTIEGVLAARIDLLSRAAVELLLAAAVVGRRVPILLLEGVLQGRTIDESVDELVRTGFLERAREDRSELLVFHHALVQDAAYSRILRRRRRELHLRVAEVAEALYGSGDHVIDLLARHVYLGAGEKAAEYLVRAGARAQRLFANEEAILHFNRALELVPDDDEIRLRLAGLHELVGNYDEALRLHEHVRERRPDDVRAWAGAASALRRKGELEAALALVDQAFRTSALRDADLAPLWLEQGWTLSVAGRYDQAIDVFLAGLELLTPDQRALEAKFLLNLSRAEMLEGRLNDALNHGLEAERSATERGELADVAAATRVLGDTYRLLGRVDDAAATLRRGLEVAERIGSTEEVAGCLVNLGIVELSLGNFDAALACNERAIELAEAIGHGSGRATAYSNQAWTLAQAGRYEEALEACAKALELARSMGNKVTVAQTLDTVAFLALRRRDFGEAASSAEEAAQLFLEMKMRPEAQEALDRAAEAWENAGDGEQALAVRTRARSLSFSGA
jgi:adenylate cyclase